MGTPTRAQLKKILIIFMGLLSCGGCGAVGELLGVGGGPQQALDSDTILEEKDDGDGKVVDQSGQNVGSTGMVPTSGTLPPGWNPPPPPDGPAPIPPVPTFPGSVDVNSTRTTVAQNQPASTTSGQVVTVTGPLFTDRLYCDVSFNIRLDPSQMDHDASCPAPESPADLDLNSQLDLCPDQNTFFQGNGYSRWVCQNHSSFILLPRNGPRVQITGQNAQYPFDKTYSTACAGFDWAVHAQERIEFPKEGAMTFSVRVFYQQEGQWVEAVPYSLEIQCVP